MTNAAQVDRKEFDDIRTKLARGGLSKKALNQMLRIASKKGGDRELLKQRRRRMRERRNGLRALHRQAIAIHHQLHALVGVGGCMLSEETKRCSSNREPLRRHARHIVDLRDYWISATLEWILLRAAKRTAPKLGTKAKTLGGVIEVLVDEFGLTHREVAILRVFHDLGTGRQSVSLDQVRQYMHRNHSALSEHRRGPMLVLRLPKDRKKPKSPGTRARGPHVPE